MLASEREKMILEYLNTNEIATTKFLCELTGASIATIRRDLNQMDQRGLLKKHTVVHRASLPGLITDIRVRHWIMTHF